MPDYVEIQFGDIVARVDQHGNWIVDSKTPLDGTQTRELLDALEDAAAGPYLGYNTNAAMQFANAAVANLAIKAEITDNTFPIEKAEPNTVF